MLKKIGTICTYVGGGIVGLIFLAVHVFFVGLGILIPVAFCLLVLKWLGRLFALGLLVMVCAGCKPPERAVEPTVTAKTDYSEGSKFSLQILLSIRHDGHLFVIVDGGTALLHHPGCPCLKGEPQ